MSLFSKQNKVEFENFFQKLKKDTKSNLIVAESLEKRSKLFWKFVIKDYSRHNLSTFLKRMKTINPDLANFIICKVTVGLRQLEANHVTSLELSPKKILFKQSKNKPLKVALVDFYFKNLIFPKLPYSQF